MTCEKKIIRPLPAIYGNWYDVGMDFSLLRLFIGSVAYNYWL